MMIENAVGKGRPNKPVDVAVVQLLLNELKVPGTKPIPIDGLPSNDLTAQIEAYQTSKKTLTVDGWIGARGSTIQALATDTKAGNDRMAFVRQKIASAPSLPLSRLSVEPFLSLHDKQYGTLSATNKAGLRNLASKAKVDTDLKSLPEFAYMLATTKHETAHTFRPISEYGRGRGRTYGTALTVVDPGTKKTYSNTYYGRGYVQLTWGYNYQKIDQKLGYGTYPNSNNAQKFNSGFTILNASKSIYLNPDLALEELPAYTALVWGMQNGIFTVRHKTGDYINGTAINYVGARRVINGQDQATTIAKYAEGFEILLRVTCQP